MTDPFESPTARWGLIFHGSGMYRRTHTQQEWARIAFAIGGADLRYPGHARGGDAWCRIATVVYEGLQDVPLRDGSSEPTRWRANPHLIRAWLSAPVVPAGDEPRTTLDANGLADTFDGTHTPDPADLTLLVDLAQDLGVVGAPSHKATLLRTVENGVVRDDAFVVVLWPPHGPARTSTPVDRDTLLPTGTDSVERIVTVLSTVATVANDLIAAPDTVPRSDTHVTQPAPPPRPAPPLRRGRR